MKNLMFPKGHVCKLDLFLPENHCQTDNLPEEVVKKVKLQINNLKESKKKEKVMSNELTRKENDSGIKFNDFDSVMRFSNMIVKSGRMSRDYNVETTAMIVMYGQELGISPMKALLTGFDIIQGKISMKPALMNEMIRKAGHSIKIDKWEAEECVITGSRKDDGTKLSIRYTSKDAEKAGLLSKDNYKKNPKNMLFARAMGNLGRMLFADVIGNIYAEGEFDDSDKKPVKKVCPDDQMQTICIETGEIIETEEKPKEEEIPIECLHLAMNASGCITSIELLLEFVQFTAEDNKKTSSYVISQAMKDDQRIERFVIAFQNWMASKPQ